ncbi:MAG: phosphate regulon sensor protein PhoR, partial [Nevskiales bacterium]
MTGARREEIIRLAAWLALCIVVGLLFDRPILVTALGLAVYASWHIWQASRLVNWLKDSENVEVPESHGLWGEIFTSLYQLQQQNRADKRQLASMLNEFQASTAALPDAVVVVDDDGCIAWCNEAAVSMLGLRVPKDIGQRIVNLLRNPAFVRAFLNEQHDADIMISAPLDSQVTLTLRIVAYGDGQRLVLARDISHIEHMERARRDFVANASHELRTPLTVIRGYLEMMEDESSEARPLFPWRSPVVEMRQQATRMGRIIEDLLKLARIESQGGQGKQADEESELRPNVKGPTALGLAGRLAKSDSDW